MYFQCAAIDTQYLEMVLKNSVASTRRRRDQGQQNPGTYPAQYG